jgi:hypothetical protein
MAVDDVGVGSPTKFGNPDPQIFEGSVSDAELAHHVKHSLITGEGP